MVNHPYHVAFFWCCACCLAALLSIAFFSPPWWLPSLFLIAGLAPLLIGLWFLLRCMTET